MYEIGDTVLVNDSMQTGYSYRIEVSPGQEFGPGFEPFFTPKEMLEMGVFEGKYCNDCRPELPDDWFENAKTGKNGRSLDQLFRDQEPAAAQRLARERLDSRPRPARLVPVVLPLLAGPPPV